MPIPDQVVRIFDTLTIVTDPVTGEVRHEGSYVEFFRKVSDPKPTTIEEARLLLRKQVGKDATLLAIVDKPRLDKAPALALIDAVREVAAHAKGATWKAEAKFADVKGGSVVAADAVEKTAEADPVVEEKSDLDAKPMDTAPEDGAIKEPPK